LETRRISQGVTFDIGKYVFQRLESRGHQLARVGRSGKMNMVR
jgi:hypothetical protein